MKLDGIDRKILNQLDLNCRQSDAEIGKKTRISKQVVNYRIKRLLQNKLINFFPHINIAKLGYGIHKVYTQFRGLTREKEDEIWNYLTYQTNVIWMVTCSGRFDMIFAIASRNIDEFNYVLTNFMNKYSKYISNREITVFNKAALHHRKWLLNQKEPIYWLLGGEIKEDRIDNLDKEILNLLNKNARTPLIDVSQKLAISSSLALQRIKKLKKKGIIGAFRLSINRHKFGINYCKSFIYYQNKTTEEENKLINYCNYIPSIVGISQSIGSWDLELEFEVRNYDEFHKTMKDLKNKFSLIRNFETVYIERESGLSFLPKNL